MNFLAVLGTLLAALFAFLSARHSRFANQARYFPLVVLGEKKSQSSGSVDFVEIELQNKSPENNAVAKNVRVYFPVSPCNGALKSFNILEHEQVPTPIKISDNDGSEEKTILQSLWSGNTQKVLVSYEDIFGNLFFFWGNIFPHVSGKRITKIDISPVYGPRSGFYAWVTRICYPHLRTRRCILTGSRVWHNGL